MVKAVVFTLFAAAVSAASFTEDFSGDWESRWHYSKHAEDFGKFEVSAGKFFADAEISKGLRTTQDARKYAISTKFPTPISGASDSIVIQLTVKHEQSIDCGGGYIKVLPSADFDSSKFHADSKYNIMFGPDICGPPKRMIHIIFEHEGKNLLWKKEERAPDDTLTHLYTLIVHNKEQTYELHVDGEKKASGKLEDDWDFLAPKEIDDASDSKPSDWVDDAQIDDATDKKPDNWDSIPAQISDPDATKPEDWDEAEDGAWEAPTIPNPEYKGEWKAKRIPNPAYKGEWKPKRIANPAYKPSTTLGLYKDFGAVAVDVWQVRSGSIFDNIYVGDNIEEAKAIGKKVYTDLKDAEKKAKDEQDEAARKAAEAAAPKADDKAKDGEKEEDAEEEEL